MGNFVNFFNDHCELEIQSFTNEEHRFHGVCWVL